MHNKERIWMLLRETFNIVHTFYVQYIISKKLN